mgnify:CR=1 FL=1
MPKGVPNQVTTMMGILERDNKNLKVRIDQLFDQRHILEMERNSLRSDNIALQDNLTLTEEMLVKVEGAYARLQGWQDCAREMLEKRDVK